MIFRESETVELKEVVVDDIKKEIIAFANCNGGKLYIGVWQMCIFHRDIHMVKQILVHK